MAKLAQAADDFDNPWKEALQLYLRHFLAFFFTDLHDDIDWSRGYQALDKEFQQIARQAKVGKRLADKLFKVWLRDGSESWLLVHVEVQGAYEKDFARRMAAYNLAAWLLYNQDVVSLAVLSDDRPEWRPRRFLFGHGQYRTEVAFGIAKLLDYGQDGAALEASDNPFAAIVQAHWQTLQTRRNPDVRQQWKLRLVKGLYRGNWSKDDVRQLFRLIDWMMALPQELEESFRAELFAYEKEKKMPWLSSIERSGYEKGLKQGIEQGIEQGIGKGLLEAIASGLETKFGESGRKLLPRVRRLPDVASLRRFTKLLNQAESLQELRDFLK